MLPQQRITSSLSRSVAFLLFEVLEQSCEFLNLQEIKLAECQHQASYMYILCRGALGRAKSATACITPLHVAGENNIGHLTVSTRTAKPPDLIPCQIFRLYRHEKKKMESTNWDEPE